MRIQTIGWQVRLVAIVLLPLLLLALASVPTVRAQGNPTPVDTSGRERIINYASDITIRQDSTLLVTETITVDAKNREINHGIYRDFPTQYTDKFGNKINIGFKVLTVTKNGSPEPYIVENLSNGKRVRIGDANVIIAPGQYTYAITYTATRELGFFSDHDELYWNVTGNGWGFPIEHISAVVHLPAGISDSSIRVAGYSGVVGSTAQDFISQVSVGEVRFETNNALNPLEGLTIVVGWPKGFVVPPSNKDKVLWFLQDSLGIVILFLTLLLTLIYYLIAWYLVGRDPLPQSIVAQYEPPQNLSPGEIRYLSKIGYDNKVLSATIISLATKGYLTILKTDGILGFGKHYKLSKTAFATGKLSMNEEAVFAAIFDKGSEIILEKKNYATILGAKSKEQFVLKENLEHRYFELHSRNLVYGVLFAILGFAAAIHFGGGSSLPFIFLGAVVLVVMAITFSRLLIQRTVEGRKLQDEIEGFKLFLSVTEKDRMNFHNPPERTPELFERYLPYALALGVEHKWAEQFAAVFASIASSGGTYHPVWYAGSDFNALAVGAFASDFGSSFSSAISSSATPPGSSSGFGGGGSGGGGGGGGGGGW